MKTRWLLIIVVTALAGFVNSAASAATSCVSVQVDYPVLLPDGTEQAPGTLTLCDSGALSPAERFERAEINGAAVGLYRSRARRAESDDPTPVVTFYRDGEGRLVLAGYAAPSGRRILAHVFDAARRQAPGAAAPVGWSSAATTVALAATAR